MFKIADANSSVFVQLIANGLVRNLALRPAEERGLIVGSMVEADFHVEGLRVAPVQFHLERHEEGIWLVPAYGFGDLRLNAARVLGPTPLNEHNVIKFSGVHLELTIRSAEDFAASGESAFTDEQRKGEFSASYSMNLPSEDDATQLAMPAVPVTSLPDDEWPTTVMQPVSLDHSNGNRSAADLESPGRELVTSPQEQTTQKIVPFRPVPNGSGSPDGHPTAELRPMPNVQNPLRSFRPSEWRRTARVPPLPRPPHQSLTSQLNASLRSARLIGRDGTPATTVHGTEIMVPVRPGSAEVPQALSFGTRALASSACGADATNANVPAICRARSAGRRKATVQHLRHDRSSAGGCTRAGRRSAQHAAARRAPEASIGSRARRRLWCPRTHSASRALQHILAREIGLANPGAALCRYGR